MTHTFANPWYVDGHTRGDGYRQSFLTLEAAVKYAEYQACKLNCLHTVHATDDDREVCSF